MDGILFIRALRMMPKFADTPIVMITSIEDDDVRIKALEAGATDFLSKRPQALELRIRLQNLIKLGSAVRALNNRAEHLAAEVAAATRKLHQREEEIILRLGARGRIPRQRHRRAQPLRVANTAASSPTSSELPPRLVREIYLAAPLHDVGKVAIPDSILRQAWPPETTTKWPSSGPTRPSASGSSPTAAASFIQLAATIANAHHERRDGSGYPKGLKGEQIPISARIVMVADVFDALTTTRPYKKPMPAEEARAYLERQRGREFDPACVDAFLSRWDEVLEILHGAQWRGSAAPAAGCASASGPYDGRRCNGRTATGALAGFDQSTETVQQPRQTSSFLVERLLLRSRLAFGARDGGRQVAQRRLHRPASQHERAAGAPDCGGKTSGGLMRRTEDSQPRGAACGLSAHARVVLIHVKQPAL